MTINLNHGKITADKATMNYLSIIFSEAANFYQLRNVDALSKEAKENGDRIYEALNALGYYD